VYQLHYITGENHSFNGFSTVLAKMLPVSRMLLLNYGGCQIA